MNCVEFFVHDDGNTKAHSEQEESIASKLGKRWKVIVFYMFYIEMIRILFFLKKCIEIVQLPHVLYAKEVQETYLKKTTQILLSCNTCGAMVSAHFPHGFNAFFMSNQHESFYQLTCVKKT
jgi:hypothetical protein